MKTNLKKQKILVGILAALGCEFLYGYSFIFTKSVSDDSSVMTLLGWRFMTAFIVLNLFVLFGVVKINLRGKQLTPLLILALFDPILYYFCETIGIQYTTASESGIIIALIPITTILCTILILKENPTRFQVTGIMVAMAGVLIIVLYKGMQTSLNVLGYLFLFAAVLSFSLYSVFARKAPQFTDIEKTWFMICSGALFFGSGALIENRENLRALFELPFVHREFLYAILYLGLGASILAFFFSNIMISRLGTNRSASFSALSTLISVIAGVTVLHESLSIWQVMGMILILGGVYLANQEEPARDLNYQKQQEPENV